MIIIKLYIWSYLYDFIIIYLYYDLIYLKYQYILLSERKFGGPVDSEQRVGRVLATIKRQ